MEEVQNFLLDSIRIVKGKKKKSPDDSDFLPHLVAFQLKWKRFRIKFWIEQVLREKGFWYILLNVQ